MNQPARQPRPRAPRLATIGVVVAVLALAAFADHPSPARPALATVTAMPVAAPAAALSSSWFCAGPASSPAHQADGRLVVANAASRPLHGRVTLIPSDAPATTADIQVDAAARLVVPEKPPVTAAYLGAVVQLDGGQAAVQQVVSGSLGTSSTACATSGASNWYFASGTTQESATLSLALLNPYPDDAIADLLFTTEQGQESPQDFQGIVIRAGTVVGLDLGSHLRRRASIATTVTLRVGRVAAFETQVVQAQSQAAQATTAPGTVPWPPGVTLVRGVPAAGPSWWWPSGAATDSTTEQYVIYNPGGAEAQVALQVDLDQGSADPFQVSVDPHAVAVVTTNTESRVPKGVAHAALLRSTNGVGVVAARVALSTSAGLGVIPGSVLQARGWLVAGDGSAGVVNLSLAVYNPGTAPVTVSISLLDGSRLEGQSAVVIAAHHRYVLAPGSPGANPGPLMVDSSGAVVVEGDTSPAKGAGLDATIAVPLTG